MLEQAGVAFDAVPADIDEESVKARLGSADAIATELAQQKGQSVSAKRAGDWVVGSDSVVSVDGKLFDKPRDRDQAADHLRHFSGKKMILTSAVALARGGVADWYHCDSGVLQVRALSDQFIEAYLNREWPDVGYCVGVFRLEGLGVQLFESIDGSYFTILGMPLLPLLSALRERGILQS